MMNATQQNSVFSAHDPFQAELRDGVGSLTDGELAKLEDEMALYVDTGIVSKSVSLFLTLAGTNTEFSQAA